MNVLYDWVKNIVCFTLVGTVLFNILPEKSYVKHVRLATGLIFIFIMLSPIINLLNMDTEIYMRYIKEELEMNQKTYDDDYQEKIMELYQTNMSKTIEKVLEQEGYAGYATDLACDEKGEVQTITLKKGKKEKGAIEDISVMVIAEESDIHQKKITELLYQTFGENIAVVFR